MKPTQAQIEAAKKAFWDTWPSFQKWWLSIPDSYGKTMSLENLPDEPIEAALTAAAEAGPMVSDITMQRYTELKEENYRLQDIEIATIERCAQVAAEFWSARPDIGAQIAAAIRALKD